MRSGRLSLLLAVLITPGCAHAGPVGFTGRVVGISDGDTITVLRDGRTPIKVRLNAIDAPETGQDFGTRAKQAASELAFGQVVTGRPTATDRYGRTVADVILPDGRSLNREMVRQGLAWWYREYALADRDLEQLEAEAKSAGAGLWAHAGAVPPWDWRRGEGVSQTPTVVGNRSSRLYHRPSCSGAARMAERNRVTFDNTAAAEAAGYRPAGDCVGRKRKR